MANPPPLTVRRIKSQDYHCIRALVKLSSEQFFGTKDVIAKIERCFQSFCVLNSDKEIVAAACFDDCPNLPAVPGSEWPDWLEHIYEIENIFPKNTLWVHYVVCNPDYMLTFVRPLLKYVFIFNYTIMQILCIAPPRTPYMNFLEGHFTMVMPKKLKFPRRVQTIYIALRHHYIEKYNIRKAVEEDNDDLVPLIHVHSTRLKDLYGEFYISEILTQHPDMNRQLIVAESADSVVAVACLNGDVDYEELAAAFFLEPYCLLRTFQDEYKTNQVDYYSQASCISLYSYAISAISIDSREKVYGNAQKKIPEKSLSSLTLFAKNIEKSAHQIMQMDSSDEFPLLEKLEFPSVLLSNASERSTRHEQSFDDISEKSNESLGRAIFSSQLKKFLDMEKENAFAMEIFAAGPVHEERAIVDMLEACFQCFPDKEYCVLTVPSDMSHFALFNFFVRAIPRPLSMYPQELYVLHRNTVNPTLIVRPATEDDLDGIQYLALSIKKNSSFNIDTMNALKNPDSAFEAYVMLDGEFIVAFAILSDNCDFDYLRSHYELSRFVSHRQHKYDRFGVMEHVLYSPIYECHGAFFMREMHRLSDMSILFYSIEKDEVATTEGIRNPMGILRQMFPVKSRRSRTYPKNNNEDIQIPYYVRKKRENFSLYISSPRLQSFPIVTINNQIVVVGASNVGLSILETLIYTFDNLRHVIFNNLTLVYRQISYRNIKSQFKHYLFVYRGYFSKFYLNSLGIKVHVNLVKGTMKEINRKEKLLVVDDDRVLPYDLLFLTCGEQYNYPASKRNENENQKNPKNVFTINKQADGDQALISMKPLLARKPEGKIIIYGSTLHVYCCIAALQKMEISDDSIVLVESYPPLNKHPPVSPFNNEYVERELFKTLDNCGVEHYRSYYFKDWTTSKKEEFVETVIFESTNKVIELNCSALIYYGERGIDYTTFLAINRAGIVFDGKVVIDPYCRTNDPFIYAAGTMTKYSRRYYADSMEHKYFDSREIGKRLGRQIRAMLLPGGLKVNHGDQIYQDLLPNSKLVPQYKGPKLIYCNLPGDLQYLCITQSGKPIPEKLAKWDKNNIIVTGQSYNCDTDDIDYFRIRLDSKHYVQSITCFTKRYIEVSNFKNLWGKHESILNNLLMRYKSGYITNLYDYFAQPWIYLLYYDGFKYLHTCIMQTMSLRTKYYGESLMENLLKIFNATGWDEMSPDMLELIFNKFKDSEYEIRIQEVVMDFIGEHIDHLSMYAHHLITKNILLEYERSPLFYLYDEEPEE